MTAMGIILTFILAMIAIVAGMIILPVIGEFFNVFCNRDDEKEEES